MTQSLICFCLLHSQVRVQPFINGRPFQNDRAFLSTHSTLPASFYKHPGVFKRSALFPSIAKGQALLNYE